MRHPALLVCAVVIVAAACSSGAGTTSTTAGPSETALAIATTTTTPGSTTSTSGPATETVEQQAHDHLAAVAAGLDVAAGQQAAFQQCPLLTPSSVPYDVGQVLGAFDLGGNMDPSRPAGVQVTCAMTDPANPNGASRSVAVRAALAGTCFDDFEAAYAAALDDVSAPVAGGVVYPELGLWCGEHVTISWSANLLVAADDPLLASAIEGLLQAAATFDIGGLAYEADSGSAV